MGGRKGPLWRTLRTVKEAQRYDRLAAWARENGCPRVTAIRVRNWVRAGLLPHAEIDHTGFAIRVISEPPEVYRQLLEICRRRWGPYPNSLDLIGVYLWLDGYLVAEKAIRAGLLRLADLADLVVAHTPSGEDTVTTARQMLATPGAPKVRTGDLAEGLDDLLQIGLGQRDPGAASAEGLAAVAELAGLGAFARYAPGMRGGVDLSEVAREVLAALPTDEVKERIEAASAEQLGAARTAARELADAAAAAGPLSEAGSPRDYLEVVRPLSRTEELAVVVMMSVVAPEAIDALTAWLKRIVSAPPLPRAPA